MVEKGQGALFGPRAPSREIVRAQRINQAEGLSWKLWGPRKMEAWQELIHAAMSWRMLFSLVHPHFPSETVGQWGSRRHSCGVSHIQVEAAP